MKSEAEAVAEAEKRERSKSKHMKHVSWKAVHNSVKGWHVALVATAAARPEVAARQLTATELNLLAYFVLGGLGGRQ